MSQECLSYEYQPLPTADHIRRLILEPAPSNDPLVGSVETVALEHVSYEAISYVWGSDDENQFIIIDGKQLPIAANLAGVLRQVRLRYKPRALWVDSICINQKDAQEKGQQVGMMGLIYKNSRRTLICLGLEPKYAQNATEARDLVVEVNMMMRQTRHLPEFTGDWNCFPDLTADHPLLTDSRWTSWVRMVSRPWFFRGWVVQEAAMAPHALVLWTGVEITWISVLQVYFFVWRRALHLMPPPMFGWAISRAHIHTFVARKWPVAITLFSAHERYMLENMTTLGLLHVGRTMGLTNPKDRIYAFMALPTSDNAMPSLKPDYTDQTTHLDVYRDFAVKTLEKSSDLKLLSYVEHDTTTLSDPRLSSWVPRWDSNVGTVHEIIDRSDSAMSLDTQDVQIISGGSALRVRAVIFDVVVYDSDTVPTKTTSASEIINHVATLWKNVIEQLAGLPNLYTSDPVLTFLWTLCRGSLTGGDIWRMVMSVLAIAHRLRSEQSSDPAEPHRGHGDAQHAAGVLRRAASGRRFILLRRGYFGLAPLVTRVGDVCAIISGAYTPFILRKEPDSDQTYKIVGAAWVASKVDYIPGIAHRIDGGENWKDWEDLGLPAEDIILQ